MITIRIGVLVLTVYHFPQYCEGVLNLQPSMGAEESICYNCTHNSPHRCVMVIILFGEWNAGFQVSFPAYYHPPLLGPCLHIIPLSKYYPQSWTFHSLCPQLWDFWGLSLVRLSYYEATLQSVYRKIPHLG